MTKTLLETYRGLYEANKFRAQAAGLGAAPAAPSPNPVDAKAQGIGARPASLPSTSGTSTSFGGSSNAINNLGRVSQRPSSKPVVDLSKPGIGPGSQGDTGRMNTVAKPISQAVSDTSSYSAQAKINKPALSNVSANQKPTNNIQTPIMDKAVTAKTAADNAARVQAIRRPGAPAPVSRTPGRGGNTGGRYGMQRPDIVKPGGSTQQPYNMNIPKKSPTLQAQTDGKTGGRYDIAPDKKPLAKPTDQPYNMNIPKKSPTLQAQTDGNITDKKPADQDIARRNARIQAIRRPAVSNSTIPLSNTPSVAAAEPTEPLQKAKPIKPTKTNKVVQKPQVKTEVPVASKTKTKPNISSFAQREAKRRVLSGKEGVGPEANKIRKTSGVKLGKTTGTTIRQKNLGEMLTNFINQKLEERHTFGNAAKSSNHSTLGELGSRRGDEKQKMDPLRYQKVVRNRLAEEDAQAETKQPKKIKRKKGTPVVFDPETTNLTY